MINTLYAQQQLYHYNLNSVNKDLYLKYTIKDFVKEASDANDYIIYVAFHKGIAIGFISILINYNYATIEDIFIAEDFRGNGIVSSLITKALKCVSNSKVNCVKSTYHKRK